MAKATGKKSTGAKGRGSKGPGTAKAAIAPKVESAPKAPAKQAGRPAGGLLRASAPRSTASSGPRGAIATKPRGRIRTFFSEVRVEMGKVTWPPRKELLKATGVVVVAVVIAGAFIGVFDYIWTVIIQAVNLG